MKKFYFFLFLFIFPICLFGCDSHTVQNYDDIEVGSGGDKCGEGVRICEDGSSSFMNSETCEFSPCPEELPFAFPIWVQNLGIIAPENLTLQESSFQVTTSEKDGYDSFFVRYNGDYQSSLQQADKIAKNVGIPLNTQLQSAQGASSSLQALFGNLGGVLYTNYDLANDPDSKYMITISVDDDGKLEIEVVDWMARDAING